MLAVFYLSLKWLHIFRILIFSTVTCKFVMRSGRNWIHLNSCWMCYYKSGRGLEVPTTIPLYTFTKLAPVQSLTELRGLRSLFLIPIFA